MSSAAPVLLPTPRDFTAAYKELEQMGEIRSEWINNPRYVRRTVWFYAPLVGALPVRQISSLSSRVIIPPLAGEPKYAHEPVVAHFKPNPVRLISNFRDPNLLKNASRPNHAKFVT
jgi:hypothetical protein